MGIFLNNKSVYTKYKEIALDRYFVDKSGMIEEIIPFIRSLNRYLCFTRPRRFGKSVMASMVASYFSNAINSSDVFDKLNISAAECYRAHLNQYNVICIDFSIAPRSCQSYHEYIEHIQMGINKELVNQYPDKGLLISESVWTSLEKTEENFIFVIDEWDAVFHMDFMTEKDKAQYLLFLKNLLKDKAYVALVYMTGVLPIQKYSSGSEINMFSEYNMVSMKKFSGYFGFTDEEVDKLFHLYEAYQADAEVTREDLRLWYDGYYTAKGERLYNPRSIILALVNNQVSNYWTNSGPYDEIFYYVQQDINNIREDIVRMISGERVQTKMRIYAVNTMPLHTKEEIYSAMVVYGLLTYYRGEVFIPNKELMDKFNELVLFKKELGYVHTLAKQSAKMLEATLSGDVETMGAILETAHNTESPILQYNNENELSYVVNLVYLAARDRYRVVREDKAGKGYADFMFYPYELEDDCIILELKVDDEPKDAIKQIKDRGYALNFTENDKYAGRILLVGIGYDKIKKKHKCAVEIFKNRLMTMG